MFKKTCLTLLLSGIAISASYACDDKGPLLNLENVKQKYVRYHDSGQYEKDLNKVMDEATNYLKSRIASSSFQGKKPVIVLDIDETALSNYASMQKMSFGGTLQQIDSAEDAGQDTVITPTLKLYQYAKAHDIAVIFLTGRKQASQLDTTIKNLKAAGYDKWDGLILRSGEFVKVPAAAYKTAMRKKLTDEGYDIILNIGDQYSDLRGGYADKNYKLPNPYYLIP